MWTNSLASCTSPQGHPAADGNAPPRALFTGSRVDSSASLEPLLKQQFGGTTSWLRLFPQKVRARGFPKVTSLMSPVSETKRDLVRGGFQPRLPTSLPPPGQQQQPSPLPRRQPVPLMPPAQLLPGAPQVAAPAPAVPLQSPPPSELMDVDPSAGPPSQAVAVQPVLQPLSLGTPKESDTAAPCPAPTQQPSTQRQETLPLFVGPDAPFRPSRHQRVQVTENADGTSGLPVAAPPRLTQLVRAEEVRRWLAWALQRFPLAGRRNRPPILAISSVIGFSSPGGFSFSGAPRETLARLIVFRFPTCLLPS
ncbi:proline-rich receptor-like protein kinase PERK13 [Schistocerca americana]|uniref:proline-rich receptor-like protein kinase PERK13 n=1 Tax=Schistocerca americana TaxID=7009 RepID=UPI001F4FF93B|nr:proline-rich receptor-like protein kinase PERK13 [Schistocerca americana]